MCAYVSIECNWMREFKLHIHKHTFTYCFTIVWRLCIVDTHRNVHTFYLVDTTKTIRFTSIFDAATSIAQIMLIDFREKQTILIVISSMPSCRILLPQWILRIEQRLCVLQTGHGDTSEDEAHYKTNYFQLICWHSIIDSPDSSFSMGLAKRFDQRTN